MPELSNLETIQVRLYTMEQFILREVGEEKRKDYSSLLDANVKAFTEQLARKAEAAHVADHRKRNAPPGAPRGENVGEGILRLMAGGE